MLASERARTDWSPLPTCTLRWGLCGFLRALYRFPHVQVSACRAGCAGLGEISRSIFNYFVPRSLHTIIAKSESRRADDVQSQLIEKDTLFIGTRHRKDPYYSTTLYSIIIIPQQPRGRNRLFTSPPIMHKGGVACDDTVAR